MSANKPACPEKQAKIYWLAARLGRIERAGQLAQEVGVNGVPFFMINRRVALAGAQPPESFLAAFQQVAST